MLKFSDEDCASIEHSVRPYLEAASKKEESGSDAWRIVPYLVRYPAYIAGGILAMAAASVSTLAIPALIGHVIDAALVPRDAAQLWIGVFALIALELVRLVSSSLQGIVFGHLGQFVVDDLRNALMRHIVRVRAEALDRSSLGQLISRVTNDTAALTQVFTSTVVGIIEKFFVVAGIGIVLLYMNVRLTVTALGLLPLLGIGGWYASRLIYRFSGQIRRSIGGVTAFLTDTLQGMVVVRLFNRGETQVRRFEVLNAELTEAQRISVVVNAYLHPGMTLINAISIALLMWVGGGMVQRNELRVGELTAFIAYVMWLFWPVMHIINQWNVLISGVASAERVFGVFSLPVEDPAPQKGIVITGRISFENVWFAYRGEEWALKDVSFTIEPGEEIGIVGATGSGKSTILALIFRLYEPQKGRILIDSIPASEIPLGDLRSQIALVQQDGALFDGTVGENVDVDTLGDMRSSAHSIRAYQDRNVNSLSAGERQWVAFLRAAARRPSIWILDEAAAHLDPSLDAELHTLVHRQAGNSTVVVVAHRLSSVRNLDRILVLHGGRIMESGTHNDLLAAKGLYFRLVELQEAVQLAS